MAADPPEVSTDVESPCRFAFSFSIGGDLRYLSHHDTLRMFRRALARAALPVRFSQGFNPQPKMSIPLPRPVGIATDCDVIVVHMDSCVTADEAVNRLRSQSPVGLTMISGRQLAVREKLHADVVRYRLELDGDDKTNWDDVVCEIESREAIEIKRVDHKTGRVKTLDIRPCLVEMKYSDSAMLFALRSDQTGTAKPAEIAALIGLDLKTANHRIRRLNIEWRTNSSEYTHGLEGRKNEKDNEKITQDQESNQG